LYHSIIKQSST